MNNKNLLTLVIVMVFFLSGFYLFSSFIVYSTDDELNTDSTNDFIYPKIAGSIPFDYYQDIKIGENYVYNVSSFGADALWSNFTGGVDDWKTHVNEQILVNFTGFFNRDPFDPGDTFPDTNMPWINISIFELGGVLNYTNANVSNSEVSRNLNLGFANFQPGFLITVNHTDWIKANASLEANGNSNSFADLTIEETYNFLYFKFEQNGLINNKTELIYDRLSGLLVRANITVGDYHIDLYWESYTLDFEKEYVYDIETFGPPGYAFWNDLWYTYIDTWALRTGSWIKVNFTGYYHADPKSTPTFDDFSDQAKRVWLDFKAVYNGDGGPIETMALYNISNQEAAFSVALNIGNLYPGFLLITVNNQSFDLENKVKNPTAVWLDGEMTYEETDLTIKIAYEYNEDNQIAYKQDTYLIYEKITGLLLWADTISGDNYHLGMSIGDYEPPTTTSTPAGAALGAGDDDDDDDDKEAIPSFPLALILLVSTVATIILILKLRKTKSRYF